MAAGRRADRSWLPRVGLVVVVAALPWGACPRGNSTVLLGGPAGFLGLGYPDCWVRYDWGPRGDEWDVRPLSWSGIAAVVAASGPALLLARSVAARIRTGRSRRTSRGGPTEPGSVSSG